MEQAELKKQIGLKIRQLRSVKGWSRQQMADKLDMSVTGYGSIERGECDIAITRMAQIAEALEIALSDLLGWDEKTVFNINQDNIKGCDNWQFSGRMDNASEIIINAQKTEIENLKQQIIQLQEIITLLKKK
jgi:transcriptional regulator with XRE-family HTH domain